MNAIALFTAMLFSFLGLTAAKAEYVDRSERALISVINVNTKNQSAIKNTWYSIENIGAKSSIRSKAGLHYGKMRFFFGRQATLNNLVEQIREYDTDPSIKAIDVIIYIHGEPGQLRFVQDPNGKREKFSKYLSMADVTAPIKAIGSTKLRALYSDSCYGSTHIQDWLATGFKVVSGSTAVDANQSRDLGIFLRNWTRHETFEYSINQANREFTYHTLDKWVKNGNSFKQWNGRGETTIDHY